MLAVDVVFGDHIHMNTMVTELVSTRQVSVTVIFIYNDVLTKWRFCGIICSSFFIINYGLLRLKISNPTSVFVYQMRGY